MDQLGGVGFRKKKPWKKVLNLDHFLLNRYLKIIIFQPPPSQVVSTPSQFGEILPKKNHQRPKFDSLGPHLPSTTFNAGHQLIAGTVRDQTSNQRRFPIDGNQKSGCITQLRLVHPRKLTWNLKMEVWKMIFLFKQVMFRFHVSFGGCSLSHLQGFKNIHSRWLCLGFLNHQQLVHDGNIPCNHEKSAPPASFQATLRRMMHNITLDSDRSLNVNTGESR